MTTIAHAGPHPTPAPTPQLFFAPVERYDKPAALQVKVDGRYVPISHRTLAERVRHTALGLRALGLQRGDRIGILSVNRPEWAIADFACLTAQMADVPIYPTLPGEQVAYILRDSGAAAVFVGDVTQLEKIVEMRKDLPVLRHVITFAATRGAADMTLADLEARGQATETPAVVSQYRRDALEVQPHELATIIYTSGTTGPPKG